MDSTTVATVNTKRGRAKPRPIANIIGHQEAKTPEARTRIQAALTGYDHFEAGPGWARSLLVSWRADLFEPVPTAEWVPDVFGPDPIPGMTVDEFGVSWLVVDEIRLVTPGRGWVLLALRQKTTGLVVFVLNGHPINSAFSRRPTPPIRVKVNGQWVWVGGKTWRKEQWLRQRLVADRIIRAVTAAGRELVTVADWNKPRVTIAGLDAARRGDPPRGVGAYDQIHATPGLRVRGFKAGPDNGSDHPPRVATIGDKETTVPKPTITQQFVAALRAEGVTVLDRPDWGTTAEHIYQERRRSRPHRLIPRRPADTLWQHVTVTRATKDPAADMRLIEQIGIDRFGSGVSYNVVVHPTTGVAMIGQSLDAKGTHTVNDKGVAGFSFDQNLVALAVAWIAMPGDNLPEPVKVTIAAIIRALIKIGALTPGHDYVPHSLVAEKDCPLQVMRDAMRGIRRAGTDQPERPNKVQRAHLQLEQDVLKPLARAERALASVAELLGDVPATRTQVADWAGELSASLAALTALQEDIATQADDAPQK